MIIKLKGITITDDTKHLGGLNFYSINVSKRPGVTVTPDKTSVSKDTAAYETVTATVTVTSGYTLSTVEIIMGTTDISSCYDSSTGIITIEGITGNVVITAVATSNSGSGSGGSGDSGGTTPTNYIITYVYKCGGTKIKADTTEVVAAGTSKTFSVDSAPAINGFIATGVSPTNATINSNTTVTYTYTEVPQAGITWYVDNAEQTGKNFNYGQAFPGAAFINEPTVSSLRGVPINIVKFYPSSDGKMAFAKLVEGQPPVEAASIEIPIEDVYTSAPTDGAGAKTYRLSNTVVLADNEYLICKCKISADCLGGFWVNAGSAPDEYKTGIWDTKTNTLKAENWGVPLSIGYIAE